MIRLPRLLAVLAAVTFAFSAGCSEGSKDDSTGGSAAAQSSSEKLEGSVRMILDLQGGQSTYEKDDAGGFKQTKQLRTINKSIVGTGFLTALNKDSRETDESVAGITVEGHSRLEIHAVPGQPNMATVVVDRLVHVTDGGMTVDQAFGYQAEATFTAGSFDAFERGEDVEVILTKNGQEALDNANKAAFKNAMTTLRGQLVKQLGDKATASEIVLDQFSAVGRTVINGNASKLDLVSGSANVSLGFSITVNL